MLLAQCFGSLDCDLPHSPPWWLTAAFVAGWMALVAAIVVLAVWRIRARIARRRRRPGPGTDIEPY